MLSSTKSRLAGKNLALTLLSFLFIFSYTLYSQVSHTLNFSPKKFAISEITGKDIINYTKVEYNDLQKTGEPGNPELPVKYVHLIIPTNQNVNEVKINLSGQDILEISRQVYPAQPDIPTSIDFQEPDFVKPKAEVYNSNEPFPSKIVQVIHDGYFDGNNHIVALAVYPFQYIPKENQLIFHPDINFELQMEPATAPNLNV